MLLSVAAAAGGAPAQDGHSEEVEETVEVTGRRAAALSQRSSTEAAAQSASLAEVLAQLAAQSSVNPPAGTLREPDAEGAGPAEALAQLALVAESEKLGSSRNVSASAAASAAGVGTADPGSSARRRRPVSASLVQAIAMCQHKQRIMAERRAQAKSTCAALLGKRVIVQWNKDEAYAGEAAGSASTLGEQTMLVKYDDGEEMWETVEPNKFREIPQECQTPACATCGGDDLASLQFCAGCEAAHHESCAMHAISIQCGGKATFAKEWFCDKCTAKQAGCKACKGGRSSHTCEDGPWRVRHSRYGKGIQPRTPGAAYRLPHLPGSSPRARTNRLSFGGFLSQEEMWSPEEDANLRLLVERDGSGKWTSKAIEFNSMPNSSLTATRSDSALRHRWIALQKQNGDANGLGSTAKSLRTSSSSSGSSAKGLRTSSSSGGHSAKSLRTGSSSGGSISSSRKRQREQTSLSYDEIIDRLDLDGGSDVYTRIFEVLGCAELLVLLRTHGIDVYQEVRLECGSRMKKTKHMLVDDVCKLVQLKKIH